MKYHFNVKILLALLLCTLLFSGSKGYAQTITENQPLDFGRFVITDNSASHQIRLLNSCGFNADPEFVFFIDPQCGNYTVTGHPPNTNLTITVTTTTLANGGSATFTTNSTFTRPNNVRTDALGEATFDVGATLVTDGTGTSFIDGAHNGTYTITVTP